MVRILPFLFVLLGAQSAATSQPRLAWPVDEPLNENVLLQMHPDNDRNPGSMTDYRCGTQYVYDGHRGTDITALNFRLMDEGVPILAAADGVVSWIRDGEFDRNYWPPYRCDPNAIIVQHPDGWSHQYWHLRQNSVAVSVGDTVTTGQVIAYIGSSGQTPIPHLHFEVWTRRGGTMTFHDPFPGGCNDRAGLWTDSYPYPGDTEFRVFDGDVMLDKALKGVESNNYFGERSLKDRPFRPLAVSNQEERIAFWVLLQADAGAEYVVRLLRPDGSAFNSETKTMLGTRAGMQWHVFSWWWGSLLVPDSTFGVWNFEVEYDGEVVHETRFEVGPETVMPIRFYPLAGRSVKLGEAHEERLKVVNAAGDVSFRLVDAPPFVSLAGDMLSVDALGRLDTRHGYFQAVAEDESGRTDTMRFHLIDLEAPVQNMPVSAEEATPGDRPSGGLTVSPNPMKGSAAVRFRVALAGHTTVSLVDVLGRTVRILGDGLATRGEHRLQLRSDGLPSGRYFVVLTTPVDRRVLPITVLRY